MFVLIMLLLIFVCNVIFEIPMYLIILGIVGFVLVVFITSVVEIKNQKETAEKITHATLITETAVYVKKEKLTGYSVSRRGSCAHYSYIDEIDHYECVFMVVYNDGKTDTLTCVKNSVLYKALIAKDTY